jgi:hypothetical protein
MGRLREKRAGVGRRQKGKEGERRGREGRRREGRDGTGRKNDTLPRAQKFLTTALCTCSKFDSNYD